MVFVALALHVAYLVLFKSRLEYPPHTLEILLRSKSTPHVVLCPGVSVDAGGECPSRGDRTDDYGICATTVHTPGILEHCHQLDKGCSRAVLRSGDQRWPCACSISTLSVSLTTVRLLHLVFSRLMSALCFVIFDVRVMFPNGTFFFVVRGCFFR